jgi:large repetitive protein
MRRLVSLALFCGLVAPLGSATALGHPGTDAPGTRVSIGNVTVIEGDAGTVNATFAVTLNQASDLSVSVNYATANDTASAPADYQASGSTLVFAPGERTLPVTVVVNGDTIDEADERFFVDLSNPVNAEIGDGRGSGGITDDDGPAISIEDVTVVEGNLGTTTAGFVASLSAASPQPVSVSYAIADGTATTPGDYLAVPGTLTFVNLSGAVDGTIADAQARGTITNDDGPPSLSINNVSVPEGNAGTASATFTVTLAPASGHTVTVDYATSDGTATAPADYTPTSGQLAFAPGDTTHTLVVPVNGDTVDEINENFTVTLTNPVHATIGDGQGRGTITDDDGPAISIGDTTAVEGTPAGFVVSLTAPSPQAVSVTYATANGTATAPADYEAAGATVLTFAPGEVEKTVTVPVKQDTIDEPNETFFVNLANPGNATIADGQGLGTILDDDGPPGLSVSDVSVAEGQSGTVNANLTVTLLPASGQTATVSFATADGTATAGTDYAATSGMLEFQSGETTKTVPVVVKGDELDENEETFTLSLSNPVNAAIVDPQGVGTIKDDDAQPQLAVNDLTVTEGNSGTVDATFTISLNAPSGRDLSIDYATVDGTAQAPGDYVAVPTTRLIFQAGQTARTVAVKINGETLVEPDETFALNLSNPTNVTIGDGEALGTILNDDAAPPPQLPPPPPAAPPSLPAPPLAVRRSRATALYAPPAGARLTTPPLLAWRAVPKARFYNVQLYRKGRKILSVWPHKPRLRLRRQWTYKGRRYRLRSASYTWIVWPAYGSPARPHFGRMLGKSSFWIV